jgi:hypothetical protein
MGASGGRARQRLFVFVAQGVAEPSTGYRPGARRALMIFVTAQTIEDARLRASDFAGRQGWAHAELKRGKVIGRDTRSMADDTLRAAAEDALHAGAGLVVYRDEIPPDA